jgi:predicted aspartyl protease
MSRAFSFLALLAVLVVGAWYYMRQTQNVMSTGTANPTAAVDLMGVRADLLAMALAERTHAALKGSYASLADLRAQGDLTIERDRRGPYIYSAEVSDTSFRIVATYTGRENPGAPRQLSIDQTMEVSVP